MKELRTTVRSLVRRPLFSLVVVVTLALGIGASTAISSVAEAVLLRDLPYRDSARLVDVYSTVERQGNVERRAFSFADFADLGSEARALDLVAAYGDGFATLQLDGRAERVESSMVSSDYFRVLGVEPALGRGLSREPAEASGEIVLSHRLHARLFAGEPEAVGERLMVDGEPRTVVGVMPAAFLDLSGETELWESIAILSERAREDRGSRFLSVVGRLAEGVDLDGAGEEVSTLFAGLAEEYPDSNTSYNAAIDPLRQRFLGDLRLPVLMLLGAVALVLSIACVNVMNLLLVRSLGRSREMALRSALGAGKLDFLRHSFGETAILTLAGGALGVLLAAFGLRSLLALAPPGLVDTVAVGLEPRVLAFSLLIILATGVVLATGTFLFSRRGGQFSALRDGASAPGPQRARRFLLVGEVSLAVVLTVLAGLLFSSWQELRRVDLGFEAESLAFLQVTLPQRPDLDGDHQAAQRRALRGRIFETVSALPGVSGAALASDTPLAGGYSATVVGLEGAPRDADRPYSGGVRVYRHLISPGFLPTLGTRLLAGRDFTPEDRDGAPAVALVSTTMAQRHWPDQNALGQRFKLGPPPADTEQSSLIEWIEVVGVVQDIRFRSVVPDPSGLPDDPDVYFPLDMFNPAGFSVVARTSIDAAALLPTLGDSVEALDAAMPAFNRETIEDRLGRQRATQRFQTTLVGLFAAAALILAAIGIYGVMSFLVGERTKELGIRMALGASRRRISAQVMRDGLGLILAGLVLGGAVAWGAGQLISSLLFEVQAYDQRVLVGTALVLFAIGLLSCAVPALRASRIEPSVSFRAD